jgi:hydrogenase maturation protease
MPEKQPEKQAVKPILVLGVGNLLLKDEGVGIHFVQAFQKHGLPSNVEAMEGGARGIDLLPLFEGRKLVVIVDCARMEEKPGEIRTFEAAEIIEKRTGFSMHGASLATTLDLGQRLGMLPEVVVVGIEPETIDIEIGLSDTATQAIEEVERVVRKIILARSQ